MKAVWIAALSCISSLSMAAGTSVSYEVDGKPYEGYWTSAGENAPTVILVHDWDGLTDYEVKRADMLQQMGYSVFAVDMFGKDIRPEEVGHRKALTGALYKDRDTMRALINGGLQAAKAQGGNLDDAVMMGYCFGGAVVLEGARAGLDLKGFAGFHAGLSTPAGQDYSQTKGSVMIFHGSADTAIPMSDFANLVDQLESAGVKHEAISYSGAPHAFTVIGQASYREDADRKSWQRFSEYLQQTL